MGNTPARAATTGSFGTGALVADRSTTAAAPRAAGFGDAVLSRVEAPPAKTRINVDAPVEILEKPNPAYTDEARRLRIEGEVLVEILFPAVGPAQVLRVVRGLGHGLDENAVAAAQAMRFRPAKSGGQAVDSTAIVHVVFQVAY
jgi:TonB family protein